MVRKIQGKGTPSSVNHLKKNNSHVTSKKDTVNTLGDNVSKNLLKITPQNFETLKTNKKNKT